MKAFLSTIGAVAVAIAIWGLSVTIVLAAKFTYPWFSKGLVNSHDLTAQQMQDNYDAVINYSLFPWVHQLSFDTLPISESGLQHFVEAKAIFQIFVLGGLGALAVALIIGSILWQFYKTAKFIMVGGILALSTPVLLAIPILIDFNRAFVIFHEIAFDNDLWMFDAQTDPIINYLPEALFMRNAATIAVLMVILSVVAIVLGLRLGPGRR